MMIATVIATEGAGDDAVSGERHSREEEADGLEHVRDGVVKVGDETRPDPNHSESREKAHPCAKRGVD
jgi:hypothetical protein